MSEEHETPAATDYVPPAARNGEARSGGSWLRWVITLLVLAAIAGTAWGTSPAWLPAIKPLMARLGLGEAAAEKPHADSHKGETASLVLTPQAMKSLNVATGMLQKTTYERVVRIPGKTVVVPGVGRQEVTTQSSGEIVKIHVSQGQSITPSQPLFDIRMIHDEGIKLQAELLDALAEKEVINAEILRLEELDKRAPGAVAGSRLLEQQYKRRQLNHLIASRRQMLKLLGLPENSIDELIAKHASHDKATLATDTIDYRTTPLLEIITIYAPPAKADGEARQLFVVEQISVVMGQHVETGETLCLLGDYGRLLIEGEAFERDISTIRTAIDNGWTASAAIERRGHSPLVIEKLPILYIAPKVDTDSRSTDFFVELPNRLDRISAPDVEKARLDWAFQPGQRMELRIPLDRRESCFRVPIDALARDGLENYVFQVSGNTFVRRPVNVLVRDEDYAVIAEDRTITTGVRIAMTGAYQLQLAVLNKSVDPNSAAAHGHSH